VFLNSRNLHRTPELEGGDRSATKCPNKVRAHVTRAQHGHRAPRERPLLLPRLGRLPRSSVQGGLM